MTPEEVIRRLYDLGHFDNPAHPTGVTIDGLSRMKLHYKEVRTAIASYQEYFGGQFDSLALGEHGRLGIADGEMGPATQTLIESPRCGFPDFPVGVLAAGYQEANWPDDCRRNLKFARNFKSAPGLSEEDTDKAFWAPANNWTYALSDLEMISAGGATSRGDARIYAGLKSLGGSTLAWSYLARNQCNDWLEQAYDTGRRWALAYLATVASHEVGHAIGLPHNRDQDALMYPSIHARSLARRGYPNATDLAQAKGLGYRLSGGQPPSVEDLYRPRPHVPPEDPDDPEPPTGRYWFSGGFTLMDGEQPLGKFILTPKPEA